MCLAVAWSGYVCCRGDSDFGDDDDDDDDIEDDDVDNADDKNGARIMISTALSQLVMASEIPCPCSETPGPCSETSCPCSETPRPCDMRFPCCSCVISATALGTIESVLPHCDVQSAAYTTPNHIILTPGRPDLALNHECQTLGGSATNTNFKVLGLTWPGIEPVPPDLCDFSVGNSTGLTLQT
ncbi:hypothetical protein ElyMa_001888500 [Elysia marginata]|uniref:IGFBP N-terminal domain-containing protein n=1 Tax=Elysia marginata TaxID=1093978 RepID=A0AAV4ERI3_9GAST|nr:hypothetical protein ElyMa_001888500 [Elysia marginata]